MATKTQAQSAEELAAAEAEFEAANATVTKLRERVEAGEQVPDSEWLKAGPDAEKARVRLAGAQKRHQAAEAKARGDAIDRFKAETLEGHNDARQAELNAIAGDALFAALDHAREQTRFVAAGIGQLRDLKVPETKRPAPSAPADPERPELLTGSPAAVDRHVGWRSGGGYGQQALIILGDQAVKAGADVTVIADAVRRHAARKYGIEPHRLAE